MLYTCTWSIAWCSGCWVDSSPKDLCITIWPARVLFPDIEEQRQLESNKRHWHKRLAAIDHELATEPDRIREVYRVKAQRIEPIGLVYLWPVTN